MLTTISPGMVLWLQARHARLGLGLLAIITSMTAILANWMIPAPLAFLESTSLAVPVGSLAPVATVMAIGYMMNFQVQFQERMAVRSVDLLDTGLLIVYSAVLASPVVIWVFDHDTLPVLAACRVHVFAIWATMIGAHVVGTRLSVIGVTLALLLAPTVLPFHLRTHPPGLFVTLAHGDSVEAAAITLIVVVTGMLVVAMRGLPGPP